jgi:hypothetical protein
MPDNELDVLARALAQADEDRAADLAAVVGLDDAAADYLGRVAELADPETDDIEAECV